MFPPHISFDADDNNEDDPLIFFPPEFITHHHHPQDHLIFHQPPPPPPPPPVTDLPPPPPPAAARERRNMVHRDVERQRRKEMSTLHGSLRSLLPLHYIKGKRAVSDHMEAAVGYIRELERRTKELSSKRDELKNRRTNDEAGSSSTSHNINGALVLVRPCLVGMEVVINGDGGDRHQGFRISKVLALLVEQGLNVVAFDSVRVNDRLIHTIQSEVSDSSCIDEAELQSLIMKSMENVDYPY